jgi:ankyrin repeat protein
VHNNNNRCFRVKRSLDMSRLFDVFSIGCLLGLAAAAGEARSETFYAVRNGDVAWLRAHVTSANVDERGGRASTPLMHAAAFGNLETMKLLIAKGADVNARNDANATALLWCARDPEKARLLIENGADVNVQSRQGRTPLIVAALRHGNAAIVRLLLDKGADPKLKTRLGTTALHSAASAGDAQSIRLLLSKGASVNAGDVLGRTPLFAASSTGQPGAVEALIDAGADVNATRQRPAPGSLPLTTNMKRNGLPNAVEVSPLHNAAAFGPVESVQRLLKAGAKVNAADSRGLTPLAFAVASETPSVEIVRALLHAGASVDKADNNGETPLDWAAKFGFPDILAELRKAGAKPGLAYRPPTFPDVPRPSAKVALERSVGLLERSSAQFFRNSGCVACHTQNATARAQAAARSVGLPVSDAVANDQVQQMRTQWISLQEDFLQALTPGGGANRLAENLLGLIAAGYPADSITDSAIAEIAMSQYSDGHWGAGEVQHRPPLAQSHFAGTARAIRVLRNYGIPARKQEFTLRIDRARAWLLSAKPITTEDHTMRLSGLVWSGAAATELDRAAKALLTLQRGDGGWGGNPHMPSDAYATSGALLALAESRAVRATDPAWWRGFEYLLATQYPDGAWHVRSRAIKFQPYFESGFPFGHDQWLSAAATASAAQALAAGIQAGVDSGAAVADRRSVARPLAPAVVVAPLSRPHPATRPDDPRGQADARH